MAVRNDYLKSLLWAVAREIKVENKNFLDNFEDLIKFTNEKFNLNLENNGSDFKALSDSYGNTFDNSIGGEIFMQNGRYENEFFDEGEIGFGGSGAVYKVRSKFDDYTYAVKRQHFHTTHTKSNNTRIISLKIQKLFDYYR
jgi:hypothetical protein